MNKTTKRIGKRGVLGLLDDLEAEGCAASVYVSARTLAARDYGHLLPESGPERLCVATALEESGKSGTGAVALVAEDRVVVVRPPIPLDADVRAAGAHTEGLRRAAWF